jgi:hypothetical protein
MRLTFYLPVFPRAANTVVGEGNTKKDRSRIWFFSG